MISSELRPHKSRLIRLYGLNRTRMLTTLTKTDLSGHIDYTNRNNVEKLLQTFTMRIERVHENLER
ncbi:hypothetical protein C451_00395 [Halococcus thailandensis JCM 13552]|uniref:Uncharacterized protein n=1 Tax=Halococcus thailandensis JCM 13552 TaxID=1227457 RepID=M0NI84_9EURY|nr:hypothetical protein C451_00395 [Halococcus thailandensis JCM 13552]